MKILHHLAPLFAGLLILACFMDSVHASNLVTRSDGTLAQLQATSGVPSASHDIDIHGSDMKSSSIHDSTPATITGSAHDKPLEHLTSVMSRNATEPSFTNLGHSTSFDSFSAITSLPAPTDSKAFAKPVGKATKPKDSGTDMSFHSPAPTSTRPDTSGLPTATDLPETFSYSFAAEMFDQHLNYPNSPGYDPTKLISVECDDCSMKGSIDIKQGGWSMSDGNLQLGFLDISLHDFTNELKFRVQGNDSGSMLYAAVANQGSGASPAAGIHIPGFGKAGIVIHPEFVIDWNFTDPLTVGYNAAWATFGDHVIHLDFNNISAFTYVPPDPAQSSSSVFWSRSNQTEDGNSTITVGTRVHIDVVLGSIPAGIAAEAAIDLGLPYIDLTTNVYPSSEYDTACNDTFGYQKEESWVTGNFTDMYPLMVRGTDRARIGVEVDATTFPNMTRDSQLHSNWTDGAYLMPDKRCYAFTEGTKFLSLAIDILNWINDSSTPANASSDGQTKLNDTTAKEPAGVKKGAAAATRSGALLSHLTGGLLLASVVFFICF
ncbi:histone-lysine n-methyltransferase 2e [Diplodia corticola]|uniref:Histone-lysine n-methyltransferase 2e n=1 Tax=Diplodia corticola TaxID=236234 RepID=A0A1J9QMR3_9PEZI|nr:histone-lysine n-methyltransferase 2e [Diplodia corticola]OJD29362.1 histone-lysine n-methyltransferase 2e [Diplodia corticola]